MKKSYFQRTYNIIQFLFVFLIGSITIGFAGKFLNNFFKSNKTEMEGGLFAIVMGKATLLSELNYKVGAVLTLIFIVLVGVELYQRIV